MIYITEYPQRTPTSLSILCLISPHTRSVNKNFKQKVLHLSSVIIITIKTRGRALKHERKHTFPIHAGLPPCKATPKAISASWLATFWRLSEKLSNAAVAPPRSRVLPINVRFCASIEEMSYPKPHHCATKYAQPTPN